MEIIDSGIVAVGKNPFRGMLICAIIIFIVALILYRNRDVDPISKPGNSDSTKSSMISRNTTHRE